MASDRDTLPEAVKPSHYDLSLHDLELGEAWSYQGIVKITVDVQENTKQITINSRQLKIREAEILAKSEKFKATEITYDEASHRAFFHFAGPVPATQKAVLSIKFSGTVNNLMAGFYRSKYKPIVPAAKSVPRDEEYHYMLSTQFESCDARRAFPCFDEPNLKATFDFEIEIPEEQTALSNMPEKETRSGSKDGLKVVSFDRTPFMSTYLLAWAIGDFEYVEGFTKREYNGKQLPVRVYTTRGLKEQGRFALENAHQVIDLFSELFQIDYPLPKSDLLAVHEFSHGAMENWGLVTYRTTAVLYDELQSDQKFKNRVAYVVAHELAHQWFGNLVTMDWWSELWLNEGFATWVGWYAVNKLYPSWNVFDQFVTEGLQRAMKLDSLRTSHPIEVPVRDALEVDQIFDAISYLKGASLIRMLAAHLGLETFLQGVSDYLKAHAYGNATTNDLWSALSKASGKDVNAFANNWVRTIGFPSLTIAEEPGQITLRQVRFLSTGDVTEQEDQTTWFVPLGLTTGSTSAGNQSLSLQSKETTLRDIDGDFYKLNAHTTGFYRCNYPPARLAKLGTQKDRLSVGDKIGLVGDATALAISGEGTTPAVLGFLENFQDEQDFLVWSEILVSLGNIRSVFAGSEKVSAALRKFTLQLISPAAQNIGWDFPPNEDFLKVQLRSLLIATAGLAGDESVIAEAKKRFTLYVSGKDKAAIHPNIRSAIFRIAITEGSQGEYDDLINEFLTTSSIDGKEICLVALGHVQTSELAQAYFEFLFSGSVAIQDLHSGSVALATNGKTRLLQWQLIKKNWTTIHAKLSGNAVVLDRYLRTALDKFASKEVGEDIEAFFRDKDNKGWDRSLGIVKDTVEGNARYKERDEEVILEWLGAHGYA